MPATHAMDAATGRRGSGADIKRGVGRGVGRQPARGAEEKLAQVLPSPVDVPAHAVRLLPLQHGRRPGTARSNEVPKAGGEALDLLLDGIGHVAVGAVGYV